MSNRIRGLVARPIGEGERRLAFALATAMLLLAAVFLTLVPRAGQHATRAASPAATTPAPPPSSGGAVTGAIPAVGGGQVGGTGPAAAMRAGRAFLTAFLRFAYGQGPARFPATAPRLRSQLAGFHVAVDAAQRARHVSLLALRARPRGHGWEVAALASDGTSSFPVAVLVARIGRRWLATQLVTVAGG